MVISDHIAHLIETLIEQSGGTIELKRNDMAEQLGCAPSQINYVITSRFTPERGYIIESRRGGGGFIRIVRKSFDRDDMLAGALRALGPTLDENSCASLLRNLTDAGIAGARELSLAGVLLSPMALSSVSDKTARDTLRADMVRQLLLAMMS